MRWWAVVVPIAACGAACQSAYSSGANEPDAAGPDASASHEDASSDDGGTAADGEGVPIDPTDAGTDAGPDAGPVSCAAVRALTGAMTDGKYTIDVDSDGPLAPFTVYCVDMTDPTKTPREYLSVSTTNGANTSRFAVGGYCTGCAGDFMRQFSRVRLRVPDLTVLTDDLQFATPLAPCGDPKFCQGTGLRWAMAGSCVTNGDSSGTANLDLTGTPFHVAAKESFVQEGYMPAGSASVSADRKTVTMTGGGACGWTQGAPANGTTLALEHD